MTGNPAPCELERLQQDNAALRQRIAELEQEQAALREALDHARIIADFTYDWEYWLSPDGTFRYVSPSCERMTGYRPDELIADPSLFEQMIHPDDRERLRQHLMNEQHHQIFGELQFRVIRRDGELRWIRHVCQPVYSPTGECLGQRASNRDSTRRKQAEDTIRDQQRFTQQIADMLPDMLYIFDSVDQRNVYVNPAIQHVLGYTVEAFQALGATIADLVHPDDVAAIRTRQAQRYEVGAGEVIHNEFRMRHADGSWRTLALRETVFTRDAEGRPAQILGVARDITDLRQAEAALRQNQALVQAIIDHAPAIIVAKDTSHRYILVNRSLEARLQRNRSEILGRTAWDFFPVEVATTFHNNDQMVLRSRRSFEVEEQIPRADGMYMQLSTLFPLFDDVGELFGLGLIATDITERKRMEQELRESEANLRALIDNSNDLIWSIDTQYRLIAANELFHARLRNVIGDTVAHGKTVLDPEWPADVLMEWQAYYDRALRGEVFAVESSTHFLQEPRIIDYRFRPIRTCQGEIIGVTVSGRDVTASKQLEADLRAKQARLQAIYDNAAAGICQITLDGRFLAANQRCLRMLGYSDEELKLLTYVDVLHPGDRAQSMELFVHLIWHDHRSYRIERRYVRADGSLFWGDLSLTAILDGQGRVESILGVLINITRSKEAEAAFQQANIRLQQQSIRDTLTGLYNRRYLDETLPRELQRAIRANLPLGLIMLDIDHFKQYNDSYGHDAGDALLRAIGMFLRQHTRDADIACRYGGEEFVLVFPTASAEDTRQRALDICAGVQRVVIQHGDYELPSITVSVGVAGYSGQETTAERLIKAADQALYQAKRSGRNRVIVAPGVMDAGG